MAEDQELTQAVFGGEQPQPQPQPQQSPAPGNEAPQQGVMPPTDENDLKKRIAGWRSVIDRLANDPVSQMAIMRFGTSLMRGPDVGQSYASQFAGAVNTGLTTAQAMTAHGEEQSNVAREQARREAETQSQTGLRTAQTKSIEQRMPYEIDSLKAQIRHATSQSDLLAVEQRLQSMKADLTRMYGVREAEAQLDKIRSESGYRDAMSRYADAHARQAAAIAGGLENDWITQPTHDQAGVPTGFTKTNKKSGETLVTRIDYPTEMAEAVRRAKTDVNAVKGRVAGYWGGGESAEQVYSQLTGDPNVKSEQDAVRVLSERYHKGGVTTHRFDKNGKALGVITGNQTEQPGATTPPPAGGGAPIVSGLIPTPPQWLHYPIGTKVENTRDGEWYEIAQGGMRKVAPPSTATEPGATTEDTVKYTRQKVRGTWRYTNSPRVGKTMAEWAAVDAAQEE